MFVTIHGHFYQPPRENPWTGRIPRQPSAAPFHDWNERITDQCYGPNGRSRVLDPHGRITGIVNNYEHISFDFGPTLLSDLERRFPQVYRHILEADRRSAALRRGHGNGMAQAYNHMILPLANYRDKWTQVRWGLRDFEVRFGRRSEGLWLPETACDAETLRVVAEAGVRYLVLAPTQARRFRRLGEKAWQEVTPERPIATWRPYRCVSNGAGSAPRSVDVFFYDTGLSVAVSFEHILRGSESFAARLEEAGRGLPANALVHVASDGEVYGHHEPFADMCLAYLFEHEGPRRGMRFLNYAEALDRNPPEFEVELNFTETGEGTAWSCAHGVGRWARDCGCHTGGPEGWNQRWRAPLRRGLDAVRDQIQNALLTRTSPVLKDPWAARDDYIEVLLRPETREEFLERHLRDRADTSTRRMVWSLLEASHQAMLMYTSCAWFFSDVAGLEAQQNLAYAARACELASPYVSEPLQPILLRHLERARSNDPAWENAARVYRRLVLPARIGPEHAAAQGVFEAAVLGRSLDRQISRYRLRGAMDQGGEGDHEITGRVAAFDDPVERSWSWAFRVTPGSLGQREAHLVPAVDPEASVASFGACLQLRDLVEERREEIARAALRRALQEESDRLREIYQQARAPMGLLTELGLPIPEIHRNLACHVLQQRELELARGITHDPLPLPESWWKEVGELHEESQLLRLSCDASPLTGPLAARISALLDSALSEADRAAAFEFVTAAYDTLARADRFHLPLPRTGLEPRAYDLVLRFHRELICAGEEDPAKGFSGGLSALKKLAGHANLSLEAVLRHAPGREAGSLGEPALGGVRLDA